MCILVIVQNHFMTGRKTWLARFQQVIQGQGHYFFELARYDYDLLTELWHEYLDFCLEGGTITSAQHASYYSHF